MVPLCSDEPSHPIMVDSTQPRSVYGMRAKLSFKSQSSSSFTHKTPPWIGVSARLRLPGQSNNLFISLQPAVKFQSSHITKQIMALSSGLCQPGEKEGKWKWEPPALARTPGGWEHPLNGCSTTLQEGLWRLAHTYRARGHFVELYHFVTWVGRIQVPCPGSLPPSFPVPHGTLS